MLKTRPRVTKYFRIFAVVDLFSEVAQKAKYIERAAYVIAPVKRPGAP